MPAKKGKRRPARDGRRAEVLRNARKLEVARLYLVDHLTQQQVAARLGVNQATISRDIQVLDAMHLAEAADTVTQAKAAQIERLEADLRRAEAGWTASLQPTTEMRQEVVANAQTGAVTPTGAGTLVQIPAKPDPRFLKVKLEIIKELNKVRALYPRPLRPWEGDDPPGTSPPEGVGGTGGTGVPENEVVIVVGGGA